MYCVLVAEPAMLDDSDHENAIKELQARLETKELHETKLKAKVRQDGITISELNEQIEELKTQIALLTPKTSTNKQQVDNKSALIAQHVRRLEAELKETTQKLEESHDMVDTLNDQIWSLTHRVAELDMQKIELEHKSVQLEVQLVGNMLSRLVHGLFISCVCF